MHTNKCMPGLGPKTSLEKTLPGHDAIHGLVRSQSLSEEESIIEELRKCWPKIGVVAFRSGKCVRVTVPKEVRSCHMLQLNACKLVQMLHAFSSVCVYNPRKKILRRRKPGQGNVPQFSLRGLCSSFLHAIISFWVCKYKRRVLRFYKFIMCYLLMSVWQFSISCL